MEMAPVESEWKRIEQTAHLGRWLTAKSSAENGITLTSLEFQDRLNLWFGLNPPNFLTTSCAGSPPRLTTHFLAKGEA